MNTHYDAIIIGGGIVGASMACALRHSGLSVVIVEPCGLTDSDRGSFDSRTIALNYASYRILQGIGVWPRIVHTKQCWPIRTLEVSEIGHDTRMHLSHQDIGVPLLGHVVPHVILGKALYQSLQALPYCTIRCPAHALALHQCSSHVAVDIVDAGESARERGEEVGARVATAVLTASLVLVAHGAEKRTLLGHNAAFPHYQQKKYSQHALVTTVHTDTPHNGRAYERFTAHGPVAFLPMKTKDYVVVWTVDGARIAYYCALPASALLAELQRLYGDRVGRLMQLGSRHSYPLQLRYTTHPVDRRIVLMGNAAHCLHPVAAQGFNLALRDVAVLAELLQQAKKRGVDIGSSAVLRQYTEARVKETRAVLRFTDCLISAFSPQHRAALGARRFGLALINRSSGLKQRLLEKTTGIQAMRSYRLGQGLPLAANASAVVPANGARTDTREVTEDANRLQQLRQQANPKHYDIIIVGAGLVGSMLACLLGNKGRYRVALIDKMPPPPFPSGAFEVRINAYNRLAERLLREVGVWQKLPPSRIFPFYHVIACDALGKGRVHFSATAVNQPYLGHFIENNWVNRLLLERAQAMESVEVMHGVALQEIMDAEHATAPHITLGTDDGNCLRATLVVASDGPNSRLRELAGIPVRCRAYYQQCIVAIVQFDGDHGSIAWQRFLPTGPLGLLPLAPGYCSLAWSCEQQYAQQLMAMDDNDFIAALDTAILHRLGRIVGIGARKSYPLIAKHARTYTAPRTVLVGDAAHAVHPLAGVGANLGLHDVAVLAELLHTIPVTHDEDIGAPALLQRYQRRCRSYNSLLGGVLTGFNTVFSNDNQWLGRLRNGGLRVADCADFAKNKIIHAMIWMG